MPSVFNKFDLLNFPNPALNVNEDALTQDINVLNFIFEDEDELKTNPPFNYFKYMGSMTSPPCAEQVVWFVVEETKKVGPTVLAMMRDVLSTPGQAGVQEDNYDGNNRYALLSYSKSDPFNLPTREKFTSSIGHSLASPTKKA